MNPQTIHRQQTIRQPAASRPDASDSRQFNPVASETDGQRSLRRVQQRLWLVAMIMAALGLGGCASMFNTPPPVTVPEIIKLSREGVPDYEIIDKMRKSGTVYRLKASQLAELHAQGVPDSVINYMQRTYLQAVRRRQELDDWDNWNELDGWWYGGPYWGWPDAY